MVFCCLAMFLFCETDTFADRSTHVRPEKGAGDRSLLRPRPSVWYSHFLSFFLMDAAKFSSYHCFHFSTDPRKFTSSNCHTHSPILCRVPPLWQRGRPLPDDESLRACCPCRRTRSPGPSSPGRSAPLPLSSLSRMFSGPFFRRIAISLTWFPLFCSIYFCRLLLCPIYTVVSLHTASDCGVDKFCYAKTPKWAGIFERT